MLPLTVLEKIVDGVADCAKDLVDGHNKVKLEQVQMQHDAVIGGIVLVGLVVNNLMDKCDDISVGANKNGVHFRAKKHDRLPKGE
ncbi:MAG: hypothetical protein IJ685_10325 [Selenomonadaceae bacterium]|nr:hypothetical protein [Selenomonadaceae bacterium]